MSLHQRIPQFLPTRIAHLARYSRARQPPSSTSSSSSSKSRISQTRAFRTTPRRPTPKQPPSPKTTTTTTTGTAAAERATTSTTTTTKLDRILTHLPKPLRGYTSRLRSAPLSHVVAFLILHEITAIIPLLALFGLFHYYTPRSGSSSSSSWAEYILTHYGSYVSDGITRFERYFTRKGWFGFGEPQTQSEQAEQVKGQPKEDQGQEEHKEEVIRRWECGTVDAKYRILVEIALAYALTKALLPVRIVASVSATPWFAGVLARLRNMVSAARRKP